MTEAEARQVWEMLKRRGWKHVNYLGRFAPSWVVVGYEPSTGWRMVRTPEEVGARVTVMA